jgi:hypothetical protein
MAFATARCSVNRPQAGCCQLQKVSVRIAEIDAVSATRPIGATFKRDAVLAQPLFPLGQRVASNGEGEMQRTVTVVRRNGASRHSNRLQRRAAAKQQQDALAAYSIGAKTRVMRQDGQLEHLLIEPRCPVQIIDIKAGFENAIELGNGGSLFCTSAAAAARPIA